MGNWRTMPADQAAGRSGKLYALDWSWTMDDAPTVVEQFGWHTISSRPRRIMLDTGFGPGSGTIRAKNGQVTLRRLGVAASGHQCAAGRRRPQYRARGAGAAVTDWTEFARGLAAELQGSPDSTVLVIGESTKPGERRFAQFLETGTVVSGELTGDEWLEPAFHTDADGVQAITDAGWHQPNEEHMGNWWIEFPWSATTDDYQRLAALTVTGLRDGFGIESPAQLVYRGWVERAGNSRLHLPGLGIRDET